MEVQAKMGRRGEFPLPITSARFIARSAGKACKGGSFHGIFMQCVSYFIIIISMFAKKCHINFVIFVWPLSLNYQSDSFPWKFVIGPPIVFLLKVLSVTLGNFPCNLSRNLVARIVA